MITKLTRFVRLTFTALLLVSLILLALYGLVGAARASSVLYAAPLAVGNGNCSSWGDACALPTALSASISGDKIWVKMGVHKPTTTTDRTISFVLKDGVAVYGGFDGTETALDQRDWETNITVLSGDIDNNDITDPTGVVTTTSAITG